MSELTVTVIDSKEEWQKLAPQWAPLLAASTSASVFLTWEWLSAWAECCLDDTRTIFIIVFHEADDTIGVAPFYIERKLLHRLLPLREIRFLGGPEGGSDYLDVFTRRGREREVANALYDFLMNEGKHRWDAMHLQDIPADSLFLLHFTKRIDEEGKFFDLAYGSYCPVARLEGADAGYPRDISLKRRKRFKQEFGILCRNADVDHVVKSGADTDGMEEFLRLYEEKGRGSGKRLRPMLRSFSERCNGESPIRIDLLSVEGQNVAALLHLQYRDTLAVYLMAVDKGYNPKISVGNVLVGLCIRDAITAGFSAYDFLKGEESYKFHWATAGRMTVRLVFAQKSASGVASAVGRLLRHAGKVMLR